MIQFVKAWGFIREMGILRNDNGDVEGIETHVVSGGAAVV